MVIPTQVKSTFALRLLLRCLVSLGSDKFGLQNRRCVSAVVEKRGGDMITRLWLLVILFLGGLQSIWLYRPNMRHQTRDNCLH